MPELRRDPIIGRWVIISTERAKRPHDFSQKTQTSDNPQECPFCEGKENLTPPETFAIGPSNREANSPGWRVRVNLSAVTPLRPVIKNPPAFFTEMVLPFDSLSADLETGSLKMGNIYLKPDAFKRINYIVQGAGTSAVKFISFSPVMAEFEVETDRNRIFVYLQNYYYGWRAIVDGEESSVLEADGTFLGVEVPDGSHTVRFEYKPTLVIAGFCFSLFFILISIVYLIFAAKKR